MDDRKRADYNYRSHSGSGVGGGQSGDCGCNNNYYSRYNYGYARNNGNYYEYKSRSGGVGGGGFASRFEIVFRILMARASLVNLGFAAAILGGIVVIDASGESLWKMQNSGKSFEEAMESIEKAKGYREDNVEERP